MCVEDPFSQIQSDIIVMLVTWRLHFHFRNKNKRNDLGSNDDFLHHFHRLQYILKYTGCCKIAIISLVLMWNWAIEFFSAVLLQDTGLMLDVSRSSLNCISDTSWTRSNVTLILSCTIFSVISDFDFRLAWLFCSWRHVASIQRSTSTCMIGQPCLMNY